MIDVSATISPIRNRRGEVTGASTVARDITEQRRAADALAEAEERFRGAFEEAPIGMVMLTKQLRVLRVNERDVPASRSRLSGGGGPVDPRLHA